MDWVYFSGIEWNYGWQRPQQLATRFSREGKVLYAGGFGLRNATLKDFGRAAGRIRFRLNQRIGPVSNRALTITSPVLYLPFPNSSLACHINGRLLRHKVIQWLRANDIPRPVLWVAVPSAAVMEAINSVAPALIVYDCIDNFEAFHRDNSVILKTEQQLAAMADVVFATSSYLFEKMRAMNPRTFLVPNAGDYEHFSQAMDPHLSPPHDIARLRRPILGYVGEMAQWFDEDLVHDLAVRHPEWSIVLIGQLHVNLGSLLRLPNVHFLGPARHEELPAYESCFDVCLLPLKINALTSAVDPIKFYEYLATGKPIVTTPLPQLLPYAQAIQIADRPDFANAVQRALEGGRQEGLVAQRLEIARRNTWDQRVATIMSVLRQFV